MPRAPISTAVSILVLLAATTLPAAVTVSIDAPTLNEILSGVATQELDVPILEGRTLRVKLEQLVVHGFEPTNVEQQAFILTSLNLLVPELGLSLPVEPRISLNVVDSPAGSLLELRFETVNLALPLAGTLNIARWLEPMRFATDNLWLLDGARGDVEVRSRLDRIRSGRDAIRFDFDIAVQPPEAQGEADAAK